MYYRPRGSTVLSAFALVPAALILTMVIAARPAAATLMVRTYEFSVSGFSPEVGSDPAPTDPVTGRVAIRFDTENDVWDFSSAIHLISLNIPLGSEIAWSYEAAFDKMRIGGSANGGASGLSIGAADFELQFSFASTGAPTLNFLSYVSTSSLTTRWTSQVGTVTVVPEPSTALLLAMGLIGLASGREKYAGRTGFSPSRD